MAAAEKWLEESRKNAQAEAFRSSLLSSYLAVFHAARAILFLDGYREKSHACIPRFLEANYVKKRTLEPEWVEMLDHLRETRHADQYSFTFVISCEEVETAIDKAAAFVCRMRELMSARMMS